jgi:hypothetical protein
MQRDYSGAGIDVAAPSVVETESAVSWSAVWAGSVAALALALVLTTLAAGFGLALSPPWLATRASLLAFNPILGAVLVAIQVLSAGLGGYLAGRLRTRWQNLHSHEAHFRDTAHGLLVWSMSTLAGVILAGTVLGPYAERLNGAQAAAAIVSGVDITVVAAREANIAAQSAFFMGFGLLLSAFIACVAAAVGGLRREEMSGLR